MLTEDIKAIWKRDPPFPASVRVMVTIVLIGLMLLPLLFLLVPPLVTIYSLCLVGLSNHCPSLASKHTATELRTVQLIYKVLLRKATFRMSMLVTLYDYVQTFKAIGALRFHV